MLEVEQRERGHDAEAQPRAHHAGHGAQLVQLQHRAQLRRVDRRFHVLPHAAGARQLHDGVGRQVGQRQRPAAARQRVVAPADDVETVAAEGLGAQLAGFGACGSQRKIGAAIAYAGDAVVRQHVRHRQLHAGVLRMELRQQRRQPARGQRRQHRQRRAPAPAGGMGQQVFVRGLGIGQQAPRGVQEEPAFHRQLHAARGAVEEPRAQRFLQPADQRREGRLRQGRARSGTREAALLGQRDEGAQLAGGKVQGHGGGD